MKTTVCFKLNKKREMPALSLCIAAFVSAFDNFIRTRLKPEIRAAKQESFETDVWNSGFEYTITDFKKDSEGGLRDIYVKITFPRWKKRDSLSFLTIRIMPALRWHIVSGVIRFPDDFPLIDFGCESWADDPKFYGRDTRFAQYFKE